MSRRPTSRRPIAQHGRLRSPRPLSQLVKLLAVAVSVVLVAAIGVGVYATVGLTATLASRSVALEGQKALPPDIGEISGGVNLLLAGSDECDPSFASMFGKRCSSPDDGGERNDVTMILHISDNPRRVTVISLPRDMIVPIPSCKQPDGTESPAVSGAMFNTTLGTGGLSCVVKTVEQVTGLDIPFAAKVTWGGVIKITDAIGGVTVCVANGINDPETGLRMSPGNHTISGYTALQFLRTRHGVGDGSDLGRISNQQQYLSRLAKQLMSRGVLTDFPLMYKLATTAVENITPSASLANPVTLVQIAMAVKSVPFDQIVFVQYPTEFDPHNPDRVVPDQQAAQSLMTALSENKQLVLTGGASQGYGVVVEKPTPAPTPTGSASAGPTTSATPSPTPSAASSDTAELPSAVVGQTAAENTCSNGNVRQH